MNPPSNVSEFPAEAQRNVAERTAETRPLYWSVRRELWENRFLYLAPLVVNAFVLLGSIISIITGAQRGGSVVGAFRMAPAPIMLSTFIVAAFYSLDALYGERRDRSILFWKSLPVSDRTVVFSKVLITLAVLPLIALTLSIATLLVLLVVSTPVLLANGQSPIALWRELGLFETILVMIYGLSVHALWFSPIYGWLMLVSAWARRAPLLWATLPALTIAGVERIAFNSWYFVSLLRYRATGAMREAFVFRARGSGESIDHLTQLEPVRYLSAPGLWLGLVFAAGCVGAAIRLRRAREPI